MSARCAECCYETRFQAKVGTEAVEVRVLHLGLWWVNGCPRCGVAPAAFTARTASLGSVLPTRLVPRLMEIRWKEVSAKL